MFDKLKQLTKETAIYGISTILGRFLNFILVPFYTNIFPPEEYGIVTNVYAFIAIMNIVFIYGMDSAYLKFASSDEFPDKKETFSTPTISIILTSVVLTIFVLIFKQPVMDFLSIKPDYSIIIFYTVLILVLDALAMLPFIYIRLENKAFKFTAIRVGSIVLNVLLNIVLIVYFRWGVEAVFFSNVIASLFILICLLPLYFKNLRLKFNNILFKRFLKFGLPYLPGGLAAIFLHVIDRPIVEHLTNLKTLGIYQANYRLGIFMMLFVMMFQYAWQPFFLHNAKEENAKEIFSKVFTYFTITGGIILVTISLFIDDLVKIQIMNKSFIGEAYWGGLSIVPIILLAYLFNGFHYIFSAGLFIREKSNSVPLIMGIAAGVNIAVNFILIPVMDIFGAALATLASYFVLAAGFFIVSQKLYNIKYEYSKMIRLFSLLTVSGFIYYYTIVALDSGIFLKVLFLAVFLIFLLLFKIIEKNEFMFMKNLLLKRFKG